VELYIVDTQPAAKLLAHRLELDTLEAFYYTNSTLTTYIAWLSNPVMTLYEPKDYNVNWDNLSVEHIPIVPTFWQFKTVPQFTSLFFAFKKLISKASTIYIATSYDGTGEFKVRPLLDRCKYHDNIFRLKIDYTTQASIKNSAHTLMPIEDSDLMYKKHLAVLKSRWLIKVNLSALYTVWGKDVGFYDDIHVTTHLVKMLELINIRGDNIDQFIPRTYWEVIAKINIGKSHHNAILIDPQTGSTCFDSLDYVNNVCNSSKYNPMVFTEVTKTSHAEKAPLPLNYEALQKLANSIFSINKVDFRKIANALFYKYKAITEINTTSRHISINQWKEASIRLNELFLCDKTTGEALVFTDFETKPRSVKKVDSEYAIIPSHQLTDYSLLSDNELKIYKLIRDHYLAQFLTHYKFERHNVRFTNGINHYEVKAIKVLSVGWRSAFSAYPSLYTIKNTIIDCHASTPVSITEVKTQQKKYRAPARYTVSSLSNAFKSRQNPLEDKTDVMQLLAFAINKRYITVQGQTLDRTLRTKLLLSMLPIEVFPKQWDKSLEQLYKNEISCSKHVEKVSEWLSHAIKDDPSINTLSSLGQLRFANIFHHCSACGYLLQNHQLAAWKCTNNRCAKLFINLLSQPISPPKCPGCGGVMILRTNSKATNIQDRYFWGCKSYPSCKTTRKIDSNS